MAKIEYFALFIHYGGKFEYTDNGMKYMGSQFEGKWGLDADRFGFLDLVDFVERIGYISWDKLWYRIPRTETYKELVDDKGVMDFLSYVGRDRIISVFIEGGKTLDEVAEKIASETYPQVEDEGDGQANGEGDEELEMNAESASKGTGEEDMHFESFGMGAGDEELHRESYGMDPGEQALADFEINSESSEEDIDYSPDESEGSEVSLGDLEYVDDEEYLESKQKLATEKMSNVFDVIDRDDGFEFSTDQTILSDYDGSDVDGDLSETDEELDWPRPKKHRIVYDPKCNHKDLEIVLGMHFLDGFQCRQGLTTWAIENGRFIRFRQVSKTKLVAKCNKTCPWGVYASVVPRYGTFIIKTYKGDHKCHREMTNRLLSSKWIAHRYLNVFRVNYNLSVADLREDIKIRYKTHVKKDRLYKAKRLAQLLVRGSVEGHYATVRNYVAELRRANKEGRYELLVGENGRFRALYIGLSALKKAFKVSCRPVVGLDGCHLKTYLGGILMCAVGKDGNNGMFPIAWALVASENEDCWAWFLKCFLEDLEISDGSGWTFISDQQKGLENAVAKLAPQAEHRNCARHVFMNWKKHHKGETLRRLFWNAVYSTYHEDFKLAVQALQQESRAAYEDFMSRDIKRFCKAFISTTPCSDSVDNNITECFNGWILNARGKHVIHLCEEIRTALMVRQVDKFKYMSNVEDILCPNIRVVLETRKVESLNCKAIPAMEDKFEVDIDGDKFAVYILERTCSCRLWQLSGIPCMHAICAIHFMERDPADYVSDYYTVRRYLEGYVFGIEPIRGSKMWPEVDGFIVTPPSLRKMPGRPKKKRIRAPGERDGGRRLSKHGAQMTCTNCQGKGHNIKTCKNPTVQKPHVEKRRRGRPAKQVDPSKASTSTSGPSTSRSRMNNTGRNKTIVRKGVYTREGNGKKYFNPSKNFKKPRKNDQASSSAAGESSLTGMPTQESRNEVGK